MAKESNSSLHMIIEDEVISKTYYELFGSLTL